MNQSILKISQFILVTLSFSTALSSQSNLWIKPISALGLKSVKLVEDDQSNLFVAGYFEDSLQLDSQTLVAAMGPFTAFIAKYNETQELIDYRLIYTDYEFERPLVRHLEIDQLGQVYMTGNFYQGLYNSMGDTLLFSGTVQQKTGGYPLAGLKWQNTRKHR